MKSVKCKVIGEGKCYDPEKINNYIDIFASKKLNFNDGLLVSAKIIAIEENNVIISLNDKYDTTINKSELKDLDEIKIGTYIDVFIEDQYNKKGQIYASRTKGKIVKLWQDIYDSKNNNTIITIIVTEKVQNGIIGDYNSIKIFVPFTHIQNYNKNDDTIIGQELNVVVIKINKVTTNVIASNKMVLEIKKKELEDKVIGQITEGQIVECVVENIVPYGAFVTIGGATFLLHLNEISWKHIDNPSEVLKVGDTIKVAVLSVNKESGKLGISMKQLTKNPWDDIKENNKIKEGDIVEGKVVNIVDYGIFVEILDGIEGLIHISEISWSSEDIKPDKFTKINDILKVKVIGVDIENKRISLSIKQLFEDPWTTEEFKKTMAEGTKHSCKVIELKNSGCVVKLLDNDLEGLIHPSDFSWVKRVTNVSKFVKVGDVFDVAIVSIDSKLRKIFCGVKQLLPNPWKQFASSFEVGTLHKGRIIMKSQDFVIIMLEHELEGIMYKENFDKSKEMNIGNEIEVKVIEFDPDNQKLQLCDKNVNSNANKNTGKKKKTNFTIGDLTDLNKIGNI